MKRINFQNCLIAGIDVHKYSHTAVLVNPFSQVIAKYQLDNSPERMNYLVNSITKLAKGKNVIFGLEDINGHGKHLSSYLYDKCFRVFAIPSSYTDKKRQLSPHKDKTDYEDACRVAKVLLQESDKLPEMMVSESTKNSDAIGCIIQDRADLVKQQAKLKNQLHVLFHQYYGDDYRNQSPRKNIFCKSALNKWIVKLNHNDDSYSKSIVNKCKMLKLIYEQKKSLDVDIEELSSSRSDIEHLKTIPGCGSTIACSIISEIKDISRFKSAASLAKYAGIAPKVSASSKKNRHYTNPQGNRKLNHAIYQLAIMQITPTGPAVAKSYYKKKLAEGKSKLHAIRCLKRRLIDIIYQILKNNSSYSFSKKVSPLS